MGPAQPGASVPSTSPTITNRHECHAIPHSPGFEGTDSLDLVDVAGPVPAGTYKSQFRIRDFGFEISDSRFRIRDFGFEIPDSIDL